MSLSYLYNSIVYRYPCRFLWLELIFLLLFLLLYDQLALDRTRVVFAFRAKKRLVLQCSRRRRRLLFPDSRPNPLPLQNVSTIRNTVGRPEPPYLYTRSVCYVIFYASGCLEGLEKNFKNPTNWHIYYVSFFFFYFSVQTSKPTKQRLKWTTDYNYSVVLLLRFLLVFIFHAKIVHGTRNNIILMTTHVPRLTGRCWSLTLPVSLAPLGERTCVTSSARLLQSKA